MSMYLTQCLLSIVLVKVLYTLLPGRPT
ncbi:hypothetical protein NP493_3345g00002 [Ridgeia piscesae]|uniref:Uncharacterized protein n=1 Tax=Ridgeia piscesae TaxID=27915 RepID=A0AAD9J5C4_RIDPI|nr:hypothetical protein NP493_3345g00002 [Ridgeia piscesae]